MEKEVALIETTVEVNLKDQIVVTVLGAVAGLIASRMVERGYYSAKARYQLQTNKSAK